MEGSFMKYTEYLKFYGLTETENTYMDWLYNECHHGRAYQYKGEFYSTLTGEKLAVSDKGKRVELNSPEESRQALSLTKQIHTAASKIEKPQSPLEKLYQPKIR